MSEIMASIEITPRAASRFWSLVDKSGPSCWEWTGGKVKKRPKFPYGLFSLNGGRRFAHRVSYTIAFGAIPDGQCVLHRCDNPRCVRPDHLFLGTRADNIQDMVSKGRQQCGERCARTKLGRDVVDRIRALRMNGLSMRKISKLTGTVVGNVHAICSGKTWKS